MNLCVNIKVTGSYDSRSPLSVGNTFQDPQWMPKTADSIELYIL